MSEIRFDVTAVAEDITKQLKDLVPVRTGRLKNGIQAQVKEESDGYIISILVEDYFKWLKNRTQSPRLPTAKELSLASPPLPKMNSLGTIKVNDLSPRAQGIMNKVDIEAALEKLDRTELEKEIKEILNYDKL